MENVEETVLLVLSTINEVGGEEVSTQELDRASLALNHASIMLSELLNTLLLGEEGPSAEFIPQLKELHSCLTDQVLEWETRIQRASFEERSPMGRSKKPINIPMVRDLPLWLTMVRTVHKRIRHLQLGYN